MKPALGFHRFHVSYLQDIKDHYLSEDWGCVLYFLFFPHSLAQGVFEELIVSGWDIQSINIDPSLSQATKMQAITKHQCTSPHLSSLSTLFCL